MNRNSLSAQQNIALAQQRLTRARMPRGAQQGVLAGQHPQQPAAPMVPQGADQGALDGCGPDGCGSGYIPSPFAGLPYGGIQNPPYLQPQALLGVFVQPAAATPTTLEISCGNTFFNACGGRYFGSREGGENLITSIVTGFDTRDQLCPGSGIDAAFFITDDCYCPFYFGCFSNLAPMLLTFDPIDTQSNLAPFNFVFVGDRLEFDGCFPYPPGLVPQPVPVPGIDWVPPAVGGGGMPAMTAPTGPTVNPYSGAGWAGGSPWHRRMMGR